MNKMLFRKFGAALGVGLISISAIAATPAAARDHYRPGDYYRGHDYRDGYYGRDNYRDRNYYKSNRYYRGDRYYRSSYRCRDNGTGGAVIGAIAGGLLGNEVAQRGDKTTGAVIGAAVGALAGHAIDKSDGRRC